MYRYIFFLPFFSVQRKRRFNPSLMMEERTTPNPNVTVPSTSVTQKSRTVQSECKICGTDAFFSSI
jgi:hypothetical protein